MIFSNKPSLQQFPRFSRIYKPFIVMFVIFSIVSFFIYLNYYIESPFQWNNVTTRFLDIVIIAPFLEEFFFRSLFVLVIFSVIFPLIYYFNQKNDDTFKTLKLEFQRMFHGVETEPSKMFIIVGLIFLFVNFFWANSHRSYGETYPIIVFLHGILLIMAVFKFGLLASILLHAEWNLFTFLLRGIDILDFYIYVIAFFLFQILILICYLGTFLFLELLMNKNLYPKIVNVMITSVYLLSILFIVFSNQLRNFFDNIGSIQTSSAILSSYIFLIIFIVHLIALFLKRSNDRSPKQDTNQPISLFCGNCGCPGQNLNYCDKCGYKLVN
ncbi:MAG: hypothetical protein HeimC3_34330 [Candidatus Heimdallarchaeota archaeon LC_3]|nr:MAG: hypothetical protein HeimC3_34330 [Candidatus Heimdallarchaeota archaeon LC_3]